MKALRIQAILKVLLVQLEQFIRLSRVPELLKSRQKSYDTQNGSVVWVAVTAVS